MCVRQPRPLFHPYGDNAIPRKPQVQLVEVESGDAFFEAQGQGRQARTGLSETCFSRLGDPLELVAVRLGGRVVGSRFNPPIGQADATASLLPDFGSVDSRGGTTPK